MGRHHDDRDKGIAAVRIGADFIEQSNAVETGRPVNQNDVGGLVVEFLEPRFRTGGVINFIIPNSRRMPLNMDLMGECFSTTRTDNWVRSKFFTGITGWKAGLNNIVCVRMVNIV